ncbi:MAG: hypothetical protein M1836_001130 [Candelina mexicana]|nr:MAG: hypothetical protein M1836_001130 [Candelina mexicana]
MSISPADAGQGKLGQRVATSLYQTRDKTGVRLTKLDCKHLSKSGFSTSNLTLEIPHLNLSASFNVVLDYSTLIKAAMTNKFSGPMPEDKYCDLILRCGEQEMRVHRVIVCGGSRVFDKLLDSSGQDGNKSVIELDEEDGKIVKQAVAFLYTGEYDVGEYSTTPTDDDQNTTTPMAPRSIDSILLFHLDLYAFGYNFAIPKLQELTATKFNEAVRDRDSWATENLPTLITKVYTSTPPTERGLRDVISEISALHIALLIPIPEFVEVMNKVPEVAMDVLTMVQKFRLSQDAEIVHKEVEALEELLDECLLDKKQVEERRAKEAESALEYSQSLEKMIKKIEAENETLIQKEVKAVRNAEKARDESMALRMANEGLELQVSQLSQTIEKHRTSEETMKGDQSNHGMKVADLKLQIVKLEGEKKQAYWDLTVAKEALAKAKAQISIETAKLDTVIERSERWEQCRHCGDDFNGRVQRTSDGDTLLRCDYCQTRHW